MRTPFISTLALLILPACGNWLFIDATVDDDLLSLEPVVLWTVTYPSSSMDWAAGMRESWCFTDNGGVCSVLSTAERDPSGQIELTVWLDLDGNDWEDAQLAGTIPAPSGSDPWQSRTVDQATFQTVTETFDFTIDDLGAM